MKIRGLTHESPMAALTAEEVLSLIQFHGGLVSIHVRPVDGGWANTMICRDGWVYTGTADQDRRMAEVGE